MNKPLGIFAFLTALAVVGTLGYYVGSRPQPVPPGTDHDGKDGTKTEPAKPPIKVQPTPTLTAEERVRQVLKPGYTYETHLKGSIHGPAENKKWAIKTVVDVIYTFEAFIDREIVSNDGKTIVEVRHFKNLKSLDIHGKLKDVRLDLGAQGKILLGGLTAISPEAAIFVQQFNGLSLAPILRWLEGVVPIERMTGIETDLIQAFSVVNALSGKAVKMEYVNGKGVVDVSDVKGVATPDERTFHQSCVLLSDALIFKDPEVKVGGKWEVNGRAFNHLIDPSLRATLSGQVGFIRLVDEDRSGKARRVLSIAQPARLNLEGSDRDEGRIGDLEPSGKLYFSPEDQVIEEAEIQATATLQRFSKNHLLFETAFRGKANVEAKYYCRVVKTAGGRP